jgi:alcohol dehydrogenase
MIGFRLPTHTHIAPGSLGRLPDVIKSLGAGRVMLVVDPGLRETHWPDRTIQDLQTHGIEPVVFDTVEVNPSTTTAEAAAQLVRDQEVELLVGLGGGSVLDTAKAAAMLATNPGTAEERTGKNRYSEAPLPFVAIPTTCGTGSEVTWVSVLSHRPTRSKISIKGDTMFPNQALVDADLLATLPAHMVAWTGMDALTHALEATTCSAANPVSDALAEAAISLLLQYLPRAACDIEGDAEARAAVMRASTLAGIAFGNADVAAVHCLSETIGGLYDAHHGLANAVLLTPVMRYHQSYIEERLAALYLSCVSPGSNDLPAGEAAEGFLASLEELAQRLEILTFGALRIPPEDHAEIAKRAADNGSNGSNPQPMTPASYLEILAMLVTDP